MPQASILPSRRAFTMIEMLVALAATLIMMGATVALFGVIADSVTGSRSLLEISDRLRACRNRLQADLQGATASMKPPLRPESDEGYLEVIEGVDTDSVHATITNTLFGDTDDALLLTVRSRGEPFVGKVTGGAGTVESQVAEVCYFMVQDGPVIDATATPAPLRLFTLYRRAMLVLPSGNLALGSTVGLPFFDSFDVSARMEGGFRVANALGDLTKPENRFNRNGTAFPQKFLQPISAFAGTRLGDDILLTNVLAFDVQVFDPGAPLNVVSGVALEPRDQGYSVPANPTAFGAYVDLGYAPGYTATGTNPPALFNRINPNSKSGYLSTSTTPRVYDTGSLHYENDGFVQRGATADAMTNGLDDDGTGGVDDIGEADTLPPYSAPLRAIRITVRVYEPSSQQVRQVTVVQDFLPE